jgi:UDP-4-amino-4,6-dideoxy-N-acetyl-beta-L-altrosamine N-acetyltransferase
VNPAELSHEERALPRDEVGWYQKYDVKFVDLYPHDLELLRKWRTHPDIRRWMVFREEITPEMQRKWFESIDPARERYTMVVYGGQRIGMTQLRNIDAATHSAEGGIIIFRPEHQNGLLPYRAAIAGLDWNFLAAGFERLTSTVLRSNSRARRFVRSLGYELSDPDPQAEVLHGEVTAEAYFRAAAKWRKVLWSELWGGYGET